MLMEGMLPAAFDARNFGLIVRASCVALGGWSASTMAQKLGISLSTLVRIESGAYVKPYTLFLVQATLESYGIEFIRGTRHIALALNTPDLLLEQIPDNSMPRNYRLVAKENK